MAVTLVKDNFLEKTSKKSPWERKNEKKWLKKRHKKKETVLDLELNATPAKKNLDLGDNKRSKDVN